MMRDVNILRTVPLGIVIDPRDFQRSIGFMTALAHSPMRLGVCYYPEHWPETYWPDDARRMAAMGISRVRIGEFAWSRIEPEPGLYDWGWLDRAVEVLASAGLGIIMGTPTATPPKWLVDQMPNMIAVDRDGKPRGFGSRRHYCFSHLGYRKECARITQAIADRYGQHDAIVAWQTDNEYGCHDSAVSYSANARAGFRIWLAEKYQAIDALNHAWGNVFWSMEYRNFDEIELPNLTVTEANPAHWMDFRRFASDEVVAFNKIQVDILRASSPGRDIVHNFMGFFTQFDHHDVSRDLDVATWDSYPLGFLEQFWFSEAEKEQFAQQGHPDIAAFHHDLYRGCAKGRWWVMEQQPGPVNWARYNPTPLPGMVRLWTLEAMAHGAELVSYFRWRQAPFAQEQMHAGLLRPDSVDDIAAYEVRTAAADIMEIGTAGALPKSVALVFSFAADWVTQIQPQGEGFSALRQCFEAYTALRRMAFDVDIVAPDADLTGYALIVIPCLPMIEASLLAQLKSVTCPIIIGPRTGSKTADFKIPAQLPPGDLQELLPIKITRVESLRPGILKRTKDGNVHRWFEHIETQLPVMCETDTCEPICVRSANIYYLAGWPDAELFANILGDVSREADLKITQLPETLRIRRSANYTYAFNYGTNAISLANFLPDGDARHYIVGGDHIPAAGVAIWTR
jgi:beta-galactosidase